MKRLFVGLVCSTALLSACNNAQDNAEDRIEEAAEASAMAAGDAEAALGLTERQLLDAEVVDANSAELADVEAVLRGADGQVDRLLVEIEDSNPDKFVHLPIAGLEANQTGDDWVLATTMTKADLDALPAVALTDAPAAEPAPSAAN